MRLLSLAQFIIPLDWDDKNSIVPASGRDGASIDAGARAAELRRKPRCSLPAFHCLAVNTGDTIGLESADILQIQRKTLAGGLRDALRPQFGENPRVY